MRLESIGRDNQTDGDRIEATETPTCLISSWYTSGKGGVGKMEYPSIRIKKNGAGHGVRTRDIQLGKLALYQLS